MLGWQVYVMQKADTSIASWCVGIGGLDWLDDLVKQGLAQDLGGNGYPCKYLSKAEVILPKILSSPPINQNAESTLGDDYFIATKGSWDLKINQDQINNCQPSETITIEAWDLS
jgi:hypothetical protein